VKISKRFCLDNKNELLIRLANQVEVGEIAVKEGLPVMLKIIDERARIPVKTDQPFAIKSPARETHVTDLTSDMWDISMRDFVMKAVSNARKATANDGGGICEGTIGDLNRIAQRIMLKMLDETDEPNKKRKAAVVAGEKIKIGKETDRAIGRVLKKSRGKSGCGHYQCR
jgi:hypothetical protein